MYLKNDLQKAPKMFLLSPEGFIFKTRFLTLCQSIRTFYSCANFCLFMFLWLSIRRMRWTHLSRGVQYKAIKIWSNKNCRTNKTCMYFDNKVFIFFPVSSRLSLFMKVNREVLWIRDHHYKGPTTSTFLSHVRLTNHFVWNRFSAFLFVGRNLLRLVGSTDP